MVSKKIINEWIKAAEKDLKIAQEDIHRKERLEDVAFHCQQSVEKFLKAYITAYELPFRRVHDLEVLLETCIQKDASFETLRTKCRLLTPFYVDTRYPGFGEELRKGKIREVVKIAEEIAQFVRKKLK